MSNDTGSRPVTAETSNARGKIEYEYEVWQGDALQAGGRENDYASAKSEANHYAMMYAQDGPVEVRIYEKRLLSSAKVQPERRPYNVSGSLSEYGVFPECDAPQPAEGVQAEPKAEAQLTYKGVPIGPMQTFADIERQAIAPVGVDVTWPLSILEAGNWREVYVGTKHMRLEVSYPYEAWERLMAALAAAQQLAVHPAITHCDNCGCDWLDNGLNPVGCPYCKQSTEIERLWVELEDWKESFCQAEAHAKQLADALAGLITWIPSAATYRRLGFDPAAPMRALAKARAALAKGEQQ